MWIAALNLSVGLLQLASAEPKAAGQAARLDCTALATDEARSAAESLYQAGARALPAADWEEAAAVLSRAVLLDPRMALAHYGLGEAYMGQKRYADAVRAFSDSREAFRCEFALPAGERERIARRLESEIRELRDAVRSLDQRRLQESLAQWKEANGDTRTPGERLRAQQALEERLAQLERLRKSRDPAPREVTLALGTAFFQAGAMAEAEREFRAVLALDPRSGDAHNNLAVVCMLDGRLAEAAREVQLAEKAGVVVNPRLKQEILERKQQEQDPQ